MNEKTDILAEVCRALSAGDTNGARATLTSRYPFEPVQIERPGYSRTRMMKIFKFDGFLDRYSGHRLICPGALLTISHFFGDEFPIHRNWKTDATHFAYYAHWPVLDHVEPVSRGGENCDDNLVTTSTLRNSAKANFTLSRTRMGIVATAYRSEVGRTC